MKVEYPPVFKKAIEKKYILSIIQFGSSLRNAKFQDIDLCIVIKKDCYKNFLNIVYGKDFSNFDISLIKEEEIFGAEKFRFGKHGNHFLFSLINGRVLYGKNYFSAFNVSTSQIKKSVLLSLYIYMEDIRRTVFSGKINKNIKKRWPKFLRLSIYLISNNLNYPEVLEISDYKIKEKLIKYNIRSNLIFYKNFRRPKDWIIAYETMWEYVLKNI